jgi:hypothetical protein
MIDSCSSVSLMFCVAVLLFLQLSRIEDFCTVVVVGVKSASAESKAEPQIRVKVIRYSYSSATRTKRMEGPRSLAEAFLGIRTQRICLIYSCRQN